MSHYEIYHQAFSNPLQGLGQKYACYLVFYLVFKNMLHRDLPCENGRFAVVFQAATCLGLAWGKLFVSKQRV